jgi:seryl-tRNA synthetase
MHMNSLRLSSLATIAFVAVTACGPSQEHVKADSTAAVASTQHEQLAMQLAAQKDSLTRVVLQADDFIMHIDSSVSRVKGLPKNKKADSQLDPLARQIENRKSVMLRVDALVARARETSAKLSKANSNNKELLAQISADSALITDLNVTIKRQLATIEGLSARVDSLKTQTVQLAASLQTADSVHVASENVNNKVYYVIGSEDDLVRRGVIVREGGANLLFAHPGRTLQIARTLDPLEFTAVDQRQVKTINMPDSTRRYRVISRQNLDNAQVEQRDKNSFKGNLRIADNSRFWAPSKYLVLVEQ